MDLPRCKWFIIKQVHDEDTGSCASEPATKRWVRWIGTDSYAFCAEGSSWPGPPALEECTREGSFVLLGKAEWQSQGDSSMWGIARGHQHCRHGGEGSCGGKIICGRNNEEINLAGDKIPYKDTQDVSALCKPLLKTEFKNLILCF